MKSPTTIPLEQSGEIVAGITLGRKLRPGTQTKDVPCLRVANVKDGYLDLSEVKTVAATDEEIAGLKLRPGDILLTEGGDPGKLGRGTFWSNELPVCLHQNHIFRLRLRPETANAAFVSRQLRSSRGKDYFLRHAKQTTGIATINQKVLRAFPLLLSPLPGQVARDTSEHTNPDGIADSSARILPAGIIALSRTASVGFVTEFGRPMATSQDFVNWVCGSARVPRFLMHLLRASRDYLLSLASGAVHKTIYMNTVERFHVRVPAAATQRTLSARLDTDLAAADIIRSARAQLAALDAMPGAMLGEVFGEAVNRQALG